MLLSVWMDGCYKVFLHSFTLAAGLSFYLFFENFFEWWVTCSHFLAMSYWLSRTIVTAKAFDLGGEIFYHSFFSTNLVIVQVLKQLRSQVGTNKSPAEKSHCRYVIVHFVYTIYCVKT